MHNSGNSQSLTSATGVLVSDATTRVTSATPSHPGLSLPGERDMKLKGSQPRPAQTVREPSCAARKLSDFIRGARRLRSRFPGAAYRSQRIPPFG